MKPAGSWERMVRGMLPLLLGLVVGCAGSPEPPPWSGPLGYGPDEVFPLTIGKYGYPYVRASIDGQDVELALDTGNLSGLLLHPDLAVRLGLPVVGTARQRDSSGAEIGSYRTFAVGAFQVFGRDWTDERAQEDWRRDLDGLVGPRYLLGCRFTLDYGRGRIGVSASPLPGPRDDALALIEAPDLPGLILVGGSVNGHPALLEIDTGKSRSTVDAEFATAVGLPAVAGGYRVDEVRIGRRVFSVPSAKEVSFRGLSAGLPEPIRFGVGSDILSQTVLTVDYSGRSVLIR